MKYIEEVYPLTTADALVRGRDYHSRLEDMLKADEWIPAEEGNPKVEAMVWAFWKVVKPNLGPVKAVEEWFEKPLTNGNTIIGRCDGILQDGRIVEHKTTSGYLDEAYIAGLQNDEQILTYMWAYGVTDIVYTVCKVPTLKQRTWEPDEVFNQRCCEWFQENTEQKIGVIDVHRSKEEITEFGEELMQISSEIANAKLFYRVPSNCMKWGRLCEYASICRNYDPKMNYVGFERRP